jgi:hypothetical protein
VGGVVTCVTDRSQLGYVPTHHNCTDTASATAGALRYDLTAPSATATQVSASTSGTTVLGPTTVTTATCTSSAPNRLCLRPGPCE